MLLRLLAFNVAAAITALNTTTSHSHAGDSPFRCSVLFGNQPRSKITLGYSLVERVYSDEINVVAGVKMTFFLINKMTLNLIYLS